MPHEIIRYRPEHLADAARLLTEFWPDPAVNAAQISWLYEQNPYTDHPMIYLAADGGKIVGMRGFFGARYEVVGSGETFDAVCGTNFVTDKSVRGRGFASAIMAHALEDIAANGYPYVLSYSARHIPYQSQLRRGWHPVCSYRPIGPQKKSGSGGLRSAAAQRFPLLRKLWHSTGRQTLGPQRNAFASLDELTPGELDSGTLSVSHEVDPPAMAELASAAAIPGRIRHIRDVGYYTWRYNNNRMDYRFIYWRESKLGGFLVLQKQRIGPKTVHIVDWEAANEQVLKRLFRTAIESGKFAALSLWSAALSGEMITFLSSMGFGEIDESKGGEGYRAGLMVKSLDPTAADAVWEVSGRRIDEHANWDLRPIYSDFF